MCRNMRSKNSTFLTKSDNSDYVKNDTKSDFVSHRFPLVLVYYIQLQDSILLSNVQIKDTHLYFE